MKCEKTEPASKGKEGNGQRIERYSWYILIVLLVGSLTAQSMSVTLGILVGGILAIINFKWLANVLEKFLGISHKKIKKVDIGKYFIKYPLTALIIFLVIKYKLVDIFALLIGLLVVFAATLIEGLINTCVLLKSLFISSYFKNPPR